MDGAALGCWRPSLSVWCADLHSDDEKLARFAKLTAANHDTIVALTARIDAALGTKSRVSIKTDTSIRNKAHR